MLTGRPRPRSSIFITGVGVSFSSSVSLPILPQQHWGSLPPPPQLPFSVPLLRGSCTHHGRGDAWAVLASVQEAGALDARPCWSYVSLAPGLGPVVGSGSSAETLCPATPGRNTPCTSCRLVLPSPQRRGHRQAAGEGHTSSLPCSSQQAGIQQLWLLQGLYFPEAQRGPGSLPAPHSRSFLQSPPQQRPPPCVPGGVKREQLEEEQTQVCIMPPLSPSPTAFSLLPWFVWRMTHRNAAKS